MNQKKGGKHPAIFPWKTFPQLKWRIPPIPPNFPKKGPLAWIAKNLVISQFRRDFKPRCWQWSPNEFSQVLQVEEKNMNEKTLSFLISMILEG